MNKTMVIEIGGEDYMIYTYEKIYEDIMSCLIFISLNEPDKFKKYREELINRGYVITRAETP